MPITETYSIVMKLTSIAVLNVSDKQDQIMLHFHLALNVDGKAKVILELVFIIDHNHRTLIVVVRFEFGHSHRSLML